MGIAFLYCNYKEQKTQTIRHLIASLLRQYCERNSAIPDEVEKLYHSHNRSGTRPSLSEFYQALLAVIRRFSKVFIVVDALDECNESNGTGNRLIREINQLWPRPYLLCTSRHLLSIERQFDSAPRQEIRASNTDVEKYIVGSIAQNARLKKHVLADPSLRDAITRSIFERVDGMLSGTGPFLRPEAN